MGVDNQRHPPAALPPGKTRSRDIAVAVATRYGLDGPGIECRRRRDLSAIVQTGHGAHPASYTMGTLSFPGGKTAGM